MTTSLRDQQGDVRIYQTDDGGEINVESGLCELGGGLETAVYLSLFGGNEEDNGQEANNQTWWGNVGEADASKQFRSETQYLMESVTLTSAILPKIEDVARRDLAWMLEKGVASSIETIASIPGLNKLKLVIRIQAIGEKSSFEFVENWKARS